MGTRSGAVRLAEGMAAGDQSNGLFIIHGHAGEGFTDILCRRQGIGNPFRTFGIDVNQAHGRGTKRVCQLALA